MSAPGVFSRIDAASRAVRKSPGTNSPWLSMKKQRSASPSQAMPRSACVSRTFLMMNSRFSGSSGLGSWSGNSPSGTQYVGTSSRGKLLEDRADHRAGHAVPAVQDDLQRLDLGRVDGLQRAGVEGLVDVDLLEAPAAAGFSEPVLDVGLDLVEAAVAGERDAALLDHLRAGVGLRVVAGGAHQAAVEVSSSRRANRASRCRPSRRRPRARPRRSSPAGSGRRARGPRAACPVPGRS